MKVVLRLVLTLSVMSLLSVAPLLAAQPIPFSTDLLAMSPLGFWPLNGNPNDASGHGNTGTLKNGVGFLNFVAPLGIAAAPAAVFTSAGSQYVSVGGPGAQAFNLGALHSLTAMAWIRTENQGLGSMLIVGKFDPVAATGWGLLVDNGEIGAPAGSGHLALIFAVADTPVMAVESTVSVNDGGWHLVSATYDGGGKANGVHMYIDGVGVATTTAADAIGNTSILNSAPLTIGGVSDGSSQFEGNVNEVAVFGVELTAEQNLQLAEDAPSFKRILAQFAFGGGWYSAIYFTNAGSAPVSFPVNFTGDNGSPMTVPSISGSSKTITLQPGVSAVIEAPNVGQLVQGYVSAVLPIGVTGYGVFRQSVPGATDQEAVVPLSLSNAQFQALLYDETSSFQTGVAIVNPTSAVVTVAIKVTDINGNTIGTSSTVLQPFNKTAVFLRSLPGLSQMAGNRGTAQFTVTAPTDFTGAVGILGLRFNGLAFTSIPPFSRPGI